MTQAVNGDVQGTYLFICSEGPFVYLERRRLPYGTGLSARISGRRGRRRIGRSIRRTIHSHGRCLRMLLAISARQQQVSWKVTDPTCRQISSRNYLKGVGKALEARISAQWASADST